MFVCLVADTWRPTTGKYSLLLSHPAQCLVGVRLVELFCQQHIDGLCSFPHSVCFTSASLDDRPLPAESIQDPLRIQLPKSGIFKVRLRAQVAAAAGCASQLVVRVIGNGPDLGWLLHYAMHAASEPVNLAWWWVVAKHCLHVCATLSCRANNLQEGDQQTVFNSKWALNTCAGGSKS